MWTFTITGNLGDLTLTPNLLKQLTKKQFYNKQNAHIHAEPALYTAAKLI